MPSEKFFVYLFLTGLLVQEVIRFPHRMRNKKAIREKSFVDDRSHGQELWLSLAALVGLEVLPLILGFTNWLDRWNYRLPAILGWIGAGLLILSCWLLWRAHADLGRNWSPTLQIVQEHSLVTGGIYGVIRHPIYASLWLFAIAQALMLWNYLVFWPGLLSVLLVSLIRIPREEQMMIEHYNGQYMKYMDQVGGLIPHLRKRKEVGPL
jgi:protein-S-isoprenylcysteine O-methyltransferase Ste14